MIEQKKEYVTQGSEGRTKLERTTVALTEQRLKLGATGLERTTIHLASTSDIFTVKKSPIHSMSKISILENTLFSCSGLILGRIFLVLG